MKLELKHIAPYLPYGLKVKYKSAVGWEKDGFTPKYKTKTEKIEGIDKMFVLYSNGEGSKLKEIKPILRPLSDLTKEIEHNGEKFVPIEFIEEKYYTQNWANQLSRCIEDERWIYHLDYYLILSLLGWHFDIYGLIDKDLAVDINTL